MKSAPRAMKTSAPRAMKTAAPRAMKPAAPRARKPAAPRPRKPAAREDPSRLAEDDRAQYVLLRKRLFSRKRRGSAWATALWAEIDAIPDIQEKFNKLRFALGDVKKVPMRSSAENFDLSVGQQIKGNIALRTLRVSAVRKGLRTGSPEAQRVLAIYAEMRRQGCEAEVLFGILGPGPGDPMLGPPVGGARSWEIPWG